MNIDISHIGTTVGLVFSIFGVQIIFMLIIFNKINSLEDKLCDKINSFHTKLSSKLDSVENKLSYDIKEVLRDLSIDNNEVLEELKIMDKRLTRIETYIEFSAITSSKETKIIKPRKPRAKKNIQITMKEPQSIS